MLQLGLSVIVTIIAVVIYLYIYLLIIYFWRVRSVSEAILFALSQFHFNLRSPALVYMDL